MSDAYCRVTAAPSEPGIVRVRRVVLFGTGIAGLLITLWAVLLTGYVSFQDEIAVVLLRRQGDMQSAYEAEIGGLKAQIERVTTLSLVERQKLEGRVSGLMARQAQIETRLGALNSFAERTIGAVPPVAAGTGLATPARPAGDASEQALRNDQPAKPVPLSEASPAPLPPAATSAPRPDRLSFLQGSLDLAGLEQIRLLRVFNKSAQARLDLLDTALSGIGLDPDRLMPRDHAKAGAGGIGGPLVQIAPSAVTGPFEAAIGELEATILRFSRLRQVARSLPLARPVAGSLDASSPFGYRIDPFTRAGAMHTGVDLKAEYGTEVRTAGPGRVTLAEVSGGYGNMVEIDHGNEVVTRYAHLSIIGVSEGQTVAAGDLIGHVGSTGRSTGAHLHYETRIAGEPVNPQRFLQAGVQLAAANPVR